MTMPLQVRHVADRLRNDLEGLIDLSDLEGQPEQLRQQCFLSRALTALTLQSLTGCDAATAADGVIDQRDDHGIDGIAVDADGSRLWLVQTKWSNKGRASLDQAAALKLHRGVTKLQDGEYDDFNARFQKHVNAVEQAISTPGVRIYIVISLLGKAHIDPLVQADLDRMLRQLNELEELAELQVRGFSDTYAVIRRGASQQRIDLEARLENWGPLAEPYRAYYGTAAVSDVAKWYIDHGENLFALNLRRSLGLTEVNHKLRTTLRNEAEHFWYFNNGITLLCETVRKTQQGSSRLVGDFHVTGASVVNGAQTVKAINDAVLHDPEGTGAGRVWVRLISLEGCPEGFANSVTEATNTQNQVEARDFVALDPNQTRLRDDFVLSLHKTYVVKRGEPDPEPSAGCSVVEAARALACANSDPVFTARAKQDSSVLWETGPQGTYHALFSRRPTAYRVWRCVQLLRGVTEQLQLDRDDRDGRAATVTAQADLLTTHLVFRQVGLDRIDDPEHDWEAVLKRVPELTATVLDWLTFHLDRVYGRSSFVPPTFRNPQRCSELAQLVGRSMMRGAPAPELPLEYRAVEPRTRMRRANAVTLLVDAGRIPDGTTLEFRAETRPERDALAPWLAEDPRRAQATWVNNRGRPLLWTADGRRYSPSGLVKHMIRQVGLKTKAVQGTSRWYVPGEGSLVALAREFRQDDEIGDGDL